MDPFGDDPNGRGGQLYFNLGDVSEDILRDSRKAYENGLPTNEVIKNVDSTIWGRVPILQSLVDAFDNQPASRPYQDVGFDGLKNSDEKLFFSDTYIQKIGDVYGTTSTVYSNATNDPSADDFHYFRGSDYDSKSTLILDRYKKFNNPDGNSKTTENSPESYPTAATSQPNTEDLNRDHTLSETESYYQYKVRLDPNEMIVGSNYISDIIETSVKTENGDTRSINWYQFRIPIYQPDDIIGGIRDFKSIRFMRLTLTNFNDPIVCRFATFDLVRGEWRRYNFDLKGDQRLEGIPMLYHDDRYQRP